MAILLSLLACAKSDRITADALAAGIRDRPDDFVIVDVRSHREWNSRKGHVPGATHLAYPKDIKDRASEIEARPGQTVVLVCFTGHRSRWSMNTVREAVEAPVIDLKGGMLAWWAGDHPVQVESAAAETLDAD